ncbi:SCO3242 family prenyltransferase [Streptomyces sp. NPDC003015]
MTPSARALVSLVRAPAALSVPGDVFAGAAAAGRPLCPATLGTVASSACLYWAGMALNDYADRDLDAVERPERPIPSGQISPAAALAAAGALTATGLGLALLAQGRRGLLTALPLAGAVWAYDLVLKPTPAAAGAMATARALDVLAGAGPGGLRRALPTAAVIGLHTGLLTRLSRYEVHGAPRAVPLTSLAGALAVGAAAVGRGRGTRPADRVTAAVCAAVYTAAGVRAHAVATRTPSSLRVRQAVTAGIHGLVPLQGALTAAVGRGGLGALVAAGLPLARSLSRKVSFT